MAITVLEKACTKCGLVWPVSEFHKDSTKSDGLSCRCKTCRNEAGKIYVKQHREENTERMRAWREANPERDKQNRKIWTENNRARVRGYWHNYNSKVKDTTPETAEYINIVLLDPCSYCGNSSEHMDHIIPVSQGGNHSWENLTGSCGFCNRSKKDRSLLRFMLEKV